MKTAISIPDELFERAEREAKRLRISRSELFARAVREFLGLERDSAIRASYDQAFVDGEDAGSKRFRAEATRRALLGVEWSDD
ncbi:MAG TPA: ribbon-helix-helix protein, CopG family [Polyangiaceae bacterium]|nr:ribbon-helix-helix protein, CopG family [Polyangiaceae bacterium]